MICLEVSRFTTEKGDKSHTLQMQVCLVYIERVYISLLKDGYAPIVVAVIMFQLAPKQILTLEMIFLCFISPPLQLEELEF